MEFTLKDLPSHEVLRQYSEKFTEVDTLSVKLCLNFLSTARQVSEAFQFYFSKYGLSEGKFTVLMLLLRQPDHCLLPSEIAEKSGVTRGTITGLLDGLEKAEWIQRKNSKNDRRKVIIQLTDIGKERLIKMLPDHYAKTASLMSNLSKEEQKRLLELLSKVSEGTKFLYQD